MAEQASVCLDTCLELLQQMRRSDVLTALLMKSWLKFVHFDRSIFFGKITCVILLDLVQ